MFRQKRSRLLGGRGQPRPRRSLHPFAVTGMPAGPFDRGLDGAWTGKVRGVCTVRITVPALEDPAVRLLQRRQMA